MRQRSVILEGTCLHAGCVARVTLTRSAARAIVFEQNGRSVPLHELAVVRSDYGVTLSDGNGVRVDLVEHLLAALGGIGVYGGILVSIDGPELPLLDGGALRYVEALTALDETPRELEPERGALRPGALQHGALEAGVREPGPRLRIARTAEIRAGGATYRFVPGQTVCVDVEICFDHPAIRHQCAHWDGTAQAFARAIAPARTFGFRRDAARLAASGRAAGVLRGSCDIADSVLVFDDDDAPGTNASPARVSDEPARHKLLDLVGDLYFYGGPPVGQLFASQPGHTATHEAIRRALDQGVVAVRCR